MSLVGGSSPSLSIMNTITNYFLKTGYYATPEKILLVSLKEILENLNFKTYEKKRAYEKYVTTLYFQCFPNEIVEKLEPAISEFLNKTKAQYDVLVYQESNENNWSKLVLLVSSKENTKKDSS